MKLGGNADLYFDFYIGSLFYIILIIYLHLLEFPILEPSTLQ